MRRTVLLSAAVLVVWGVAGWPGATENGTTHAGPVGGQIVRSRPLATEAPPSGCDPTEERFAEVLAGLTDAALANAGIDRDAFENALADDRAAAERYLEAIGLPAADEQLDAIMRSDLPALVGAC